jgi:uncharacterized membrane protein
MLEALAPFHPRFVHFPIALCIVGAVFIALGALRGQEKWRSYGQISLVLGWFGIMLAVVTGLMDQANAPQDAAVTSLINQHITAGVALLITVGLALYWPIRDKKLWQKSTKWGYLALLVVIVLLVIVEAWLGGKLVYQYGVGVQ